MKKKKRAQRVVYLKKEEFFPFFSELEGLEAGDIILSLEEKEAEWNCLYFSDDSMEVTYWYGRFFQEALRLGKKNSRLIEFDHLIIFDGDRAEVLLPVLYELCGNMNQLTIITKRAYAYEAFLEKVFYTTGLAGTCTVKLPRDVQEYEVEKPFYQRQKIHTYKTLILWAEENCKVPLWGIPQGSVFLDVSMEERGKKEVAKRRNDVEVLSLGNYLDTIVKNRYNTLVNEGFLKQNTLWEYQMAKNKKIKFGRKEKQRWKKRRIL